MLVARAPWPTATAVSPDANCCAGRERTEPCRLGEAAERGRTIAQGQGKNAKGRGIGSGGGARRAESGREGAAGSSRGGEDAARDGAGEGAIAVGEGQRTMDWSRV